MMKEIGVTRRQWLQGSVGLLAGALGAAGCGGPKGEDAGVNGSPGGKGVATTVRLAFFPNVTHAVALVGTGNGAFDKALGKVDPQLFNAGPSEIEVLFADQVDIGYIGPGPAVNGFLKSNGKALRIIAGASSGGAGLVVRKDANIPDIKGLAGKKVGVPQTGGTQDISLRHWLQANGLTSTDKGGTVEVLPNKPADMLTLFLKGELDAAWVPEPWLTRLAMEGAGVILTDERTLWPDKKFATTVVIARQKFLEAHPDVVHKFLEVHVDTVAYLQKHPEEARKRIGARLQELTGKAVPEAQLEASLAHTDFTYDPLRSSVLTFADWAQALGYSRQGQSALTDLLDLKPLNDVLSQRKLAAVS